MYYQKEAKIQDIAGGLEAISHSIGKDHQIVLLLKGRITNSSKVFVNPEGFQA